MLKNELISNINQKKSYLCIGLDTDLNKIPEHLKKEDDPVFAFNKQIIDATHDLCVSYKINTAFYESMGYTGWISLEKTINYIPEELFTIADVKRSDIGNTADQYARAFFKNFPFDAVTLSPFMGIDSVKPFLEYQGKWSILLGLTSNEGAEDFLLAPYESGYFYEFVIKKSKEWGNEENMMYVVGSTRPDELKKIRKLLPGHFLLIPGFGVQGGDIDTVSQLALNNECGILANVSRSIIFASDGEDFAEKARMKAIEYQSIMNKHLKLALT